MSKLVKFRLHFEFWVFLISFPRLYNISFTTFWEVPPFRRRQKSSLKKRKRITGIISFRNFFRTLISSFVMTGQNVLFTIQSSLIDPLLIRYSFWSYFCSLNREFNKHRNSLYTDNFDLRFRWALTVQLNNTILYKVRVLSKMSRRVIHYSRHAHY